MDELVAFSTGIYDFFNLLLLLLLLLTFRKMKVFFQTILALVVTVMEMPYIYVLRNLKKRYPIKQTRLFA